MNSRQLRCITLATRVLVVAALLLVPIANRPEPREPQLPASQLLPMQQAVVPAQSLTAAGSPSPQQAQTQPRRWVF